MILGAATGLRPGELFGVTVDRVDFLRRLIHVDRQLTRAGILGPPKSDTSHRVVPLTDSVLLEVSEHLARWPVDGSGLVFVNRRGEWIRHSAFHAVWASARARAGIPDWATPHHLRHYYASLLIAHGSSVKLVQARLGHASAATTLDIYGHLWPDSEEATRAAVEAEFSRAFGS